MRSMLVCPDCRSSLSWSDTSAECECGRIHPIVDEIPILLPGRPLSQQKRLQGMEHDSHPNPELDIRRPVGTPALMGWMLEERFRRSIAGLEPLLPGATAVSACGGSGMDAELLARRGCRVLSVDISMGATRRARERALRHGLDITPVVADAEHLPLADRSVDVGYVQDGLHHLEHPLAGLRELARVAGRAVAASEPAEAGITRLAVVLGIARNEEPGGNRVARVRPAEMDDLLRGLGFPEPRLQRYGMHYAPDGGRLVRALSRPRLGPVARGLLIAANSVAGRLGNKLAVRALRTPSLSQPTQPEYRFHERLRATRR